MIISIKLRPRGTSKDDHIQKMHNFRKFHHLPLKNLILHEIRAKMCVTNWPVQQFVI